MDNSGAEIKRSDFPPGFIFGAGTSTYQVEGAWNEGGKGVNNWDWFTENHSERIVDGSNGRVATDHYHKFKDDVALIKKAGFDAYRFSISWSRILPGGTLSGGKSKQGIKFYSDLIDALRAEGIEPWPTLFHWDTPQCLEDKYRGFLNKQIVNDFRDFAEVCFSEFGDRVKHWTTLNEPWSYTYPGYVSGNFPPGRGGDFVGESGTLILTPRLTHRSPFVKSVPLSAQNNSRNGDPGTEPYTVAHNLILAHAHAVNIYKTKFQKRQGGKIGISNVAIWFYPYDPKEDVDAVSRALDFTLGWFVAPVVTGDYPVSMRDNVKERLPKFTPDEASLLKGSYDFLGINNYTTYYAENIPQKTGLRPHHDNDRHVTYQYERDGKLIGEQGGSEWLYIVPDGIYHVMLYMKTKYNNPEIYITENGVDEKNLKTDKIPEALNDEKRINYHKQYLACLKKAIGDGVSLKGYFTWSLLDNFEWAQGYTVRFGTYYVDFQSKQLTRYAKKSIEWWINFLKPESSKKLLTKKTEEEQNRSVKRQRVQN